MKLSAKTVGYALCAALLVGMLIGSALTWKCGRRENITIISLDTLMVETYIHDTTICYDTVVVSLRDTVFITPDTPIGSIPVRTKTTRFNIPLDITAGKKQRIEIPVDVGTTYRGILYNNTVRPIPEPYTIEMSDKKPWVDLYGTVAGGVNYSLLPVAEVEVGITLWQKAVLFGRLNSTLHDGALQWQTMAGAKWTLF